MSHARRPSGLLRIVVAAIGVHSCVLGVVMLARPLQFTELMGFPPGGPVFFPSQAGIFLLALGICYLLALRNIALVSVIVVSKALAVAFLVMHAAWLDAPPLIWAAAAGDAAMLALTLLALRREERISRQKI